MEWGDDPPLLKSMLKMHRIPKWESTPAETDLNLGPCKQKKVKWEWWQRGVHQLILWFGVSRTGQGAKANKKRKMEERQNR